MVSFTAVIKKFSEQGEKTGWTYVEVPAAIAEKIKPNTKKSFRVKGLLDAYPIERVALLPLGGGVFILVLNATFRKGIKKPVGEKLQLKLEEDERTRELPEGFMECLADEPAALAQYNRLSKTHKGYFTVWLTSVTSEAARAKRIAQAVTALAKGYNFTQTMQALKQNRTDFERLL